jgi:hypothetical protein
MIVHFDSKVGQLTMMGDTALELLRMMGHSGTVPSAMLAPDIPAALSRLRAALDAQPPVTPPPEDDEEARRDFVPLRTRAYPLIELFERSAGAGVDVTWTGAGSASTPRSGG